MVKQSDRIDRPEPILERVAIHTPEALAFELELAGVATRFIGAVTDLCALSLVALYVMWASLFIGFNSQIAPGYLVAFFLAGLFALIFGYGFFCEQVFRGRSLGKMLTRTRVISSDGGEVRPAQSAIRALLWPFEIVMMPILGLGSALTTEHVQRLGDLGAGTFVIRESRRARVGDQIAPTHAAYDPNAVFRTWDISMVDADDLVIARAFLRRRLRLRPEARAAIAAALDQRIRPRVAGPDPTWPTELLLEAVVAAKSLGPVRTASEPESTRRY